MEIGETQIFSDLCEQCPNKFKILILCDSIESFGRNDRCAGDISEKLKIENYCFSCGIKPLIRVHWAQ